MAPPPMAPPPRPYPAIVGTTMIALLVVVSLLMLFLGAMMMHYAPQLTNKKYSEDEAGENQREDDARTALTMTNIGRIVGDVGAFLLILVLLLAGMLRTDWSEYVRFGALFFAAVFAFSLGFRL